MYDTTGFTKAEIAELCVRRIGTRELAPGMRKWPPVLGLRNALTATLTYMRRNRVQAEIAENYGVSQPTISRAISAITPLLVQALLLAAAGVVEQLTLTVVSENHAAIALYRKFGFEVYGVEPRALKQPEGYSDEVLMVRFLATG